jgi:DNA uptake protein ComE-like DNA-binding protein
MKINTEPIKNWFGFTRRERRASFILLVILVFILGIRFVVPDKSIEIEDITDSLTFYKVLKEPEIPKVKTSDRNISGSRKYFSDTTVRKKYPSKYQKRAPVNLNSCDTTELIALPGIGPVLSARIIRYRNLLGGYASVNQLNEVYGLPPETFELIKDRVYADTTLLILISINSTGYKELSRLRYLEKYEIQAILKYRELKGRIGSVNELVENKLITIEKADKIGPYLKFK